MTKLREEVLIWKGFAFFLLPSLILGILGLFSPIAYTIIPVHESDMCLCAFYQEAVCQDHNYWLFNSSFKYYKMRATNTTVYIVVNWVFLLILIKMIWRIRHINDETLIKSENAWIVGVWIVLSIV